MTERGVTPSELHISPQGDLKPRTVYRCDRCGALSYEPDPNGCECYMGPRWRKGTWRPDPLSPSTIQGTDA